MVAGMLALDPATAKNTHITRGVPLGEAHHRQAYDAKESVECYSYAAHAVLIAYPCGAKHDDSGEPVGRRNQALRSAGAIAHTFAEDDGEEVGDGVRDPCHGSRIVRDQC